MKKAKSQKKRLDEAEPYLTRKEAAHTLRISLSTLGRIIRDQKLQAKKNGHSTVITRAAIDTYIATLPDWRPRRGPPRRKRR